MSRCLSLDSLPLSLSLFSLSPLSLSLTLSCATHMRTLDLIVVPWFHDVSLYVWLALCLLSLPLLYISHLSSLISLPLPLPQPALVSSHLSHRSLSPALSFSHTTRPNQSFMFLYRYRPRMEKSHTDRPRTGQFPAFQYCQVVNRALLRLLSTYILVSYRPHLHLDIKVTKMLYHWFLLLD